MLPHSRSGIVAGVLLGFGRAIGETIAVALVGRNHPLGVVLAALFFATLSQGGLAINAMVPKQIVEALQGIVIIAVATSVPEVRRILRNAVAKSGGSR